jgi:hypothetical protein
MGRATGLIAKVNAVLKKFTPFERTVYKRAITRTGGDSLTGRKGTVAYVDTVFSPQPAYTRLGRERVPGHQANFENVLTASGVQLTADDYEFLFSPDVLALSDLQNPDIAVVLKDAVGNSETLKYLDHEAPALNGTVVAYVVFMRSTKRP